MKGEDFDDLDDFGDPEKEAADELWMKLEEERQADAKPKALSTSDDWLLGLDDDSFLDSSAEDVVATTNANSDVK